MSGSNSNVYENLKNLPILFHDSSAKIYLKHLGCVGNRL